MPSALSRRLGAVEARISAPQYQAAPIDSARLDTLVAEYLAMAHAPPPHRADLDGLNVTQLVNLYFRLTDA